MNKKYIDVLNEVIDNKTTDAKERKKLKEIVASIVEAEKGYEFNDKRPRIKMLLDSIIT